MSPRRVTVTGATGLIGARLVGELQRAGWEVSVLSRDPQRARERLGAEVRAFAWEPMSEPAPAEALAGRDGIVNLAGEPVAQRWSEATRRAIRESRVVGTGHLVDGLRALQDRPGVLVSSSASGYYGPHGAEPLDEEAPAGRDFLAQVCAAWEQAAERAREELGMRVVRVRTGVVLDRDGGALEKMLPPFQLGVGGPVAGGGQFVPWIHAEDVVGMIVSALSQASWSGAINATAPVPVTNRELSRALGRALRRPALLPVPGLALKLLYGEMAQIVTTGARAVPARALMLGYEHRHPDLEEALASALSR
jgi:uncharacterized protein (TIGR01777 family)